MKTNNKYEQIYHLKNELSENTEKLQNSKNNLIIEKMSNRNTEIYFELKKLNEIREVKREVKKQKNELQFEIF